MAKYNVMIEIQATDADWDIGKVGQGVLKGLLDDLPVSIKLMRFDIEEDQS